MNAHYSKSFVKIQDSGEDLKLCRFFSPGPVSRKWIYFALRPRVDWVGGMGYTSTLQIVGTLEGISPDHFERLKRIGVIEELNPNEAGRRPLALDRAA